MLLVVSTLCDAVVAKTRRRKRSIRERVAVADLVVRGTVVELIEKGEYGPWLARVRPIDYVKGRRLAEVRVYYQYDNIHDSKAVRRAHQYLFFLTGPNSKGHYLPLRDGGILPNSKQLVTEARLAAREKLPRWRRNNNGLRMLLYADSATYKVNEPIRLKLFVQNVSQRRILLREVFVVTLRRARCTGTLLLARNGRPLKPLRPPAPQRRDRVGDEEVTFGLQPGEMLTKYLPEMNTPQPRDIGDLRKYLRFNIFSTLHRGNYTATLRLDGLTLDNATMASGPLVFSVK